MVGERDSVVPRNRLSLPSHPRRLSFCGVSKSFLPSSLRSWVLVLGRRRVSDVTTRPPSGAKGKEGKREGREGRGTTHYKSFSFVMSLPSFPCFSTKSLPSTLERHRWSSVSRPETNETRFTHTYTYTHIFSCFFSLLHTQSHNQIRTDTHLHTDSHLHLTRTYTHNPLSFLFSSVLFFLVYVLTNLSTGIYQMCTYELFTNTLSNR